MHGLQDVGSIPGSGTSPGGGSGNPLQCSYFKTSMDRGAWWATVHGPSNNWIGLSNWVYTCPGVGLLGMVGNRGCETREKQSRAALGQDPHQRMHTTISLSCFADTETPSGWEKLMISDDGMLPTRLETPDQLDLKVDDVDSCLPPHQPP